MRHNNVVVYAGIGFAIVQKFIYEGTKVVIISRNEDGLVRR